jgi:dihydrolipoamide dehydrogenase
MSDSFDLVIIGAGPGGYVAAIRAAQLGMKVAVVERESRLGGTCLRVGCIPSKALLETSELYEQSRKHFAERGIRVNDVTIDVAQMMQHKDGVVAQLDGGIQGLLKKNKVQRFAGHGRLTADGNVSVDGADSRVLTAKQILIATGSVSAELPGITPDGDRIGTSTEALAWPEVPNELVVIGAGVIGLELGTVWRRLGSRVTVLEYLPRILPGLDEQVAAEARKLFEKQGIAFRLGTKVREVTADDKSCRVAIDGAEDVICDRVLIAIGRRPCTADLGLADAGVDTDDRGFIRVDATYKTTADNVYAIGDVIGGAMLAHKAEEEGLACVEKMATGYSHINYSTIPSVIYTAPEIASVGANEDALRQSGIDFKVCFVTAKSSGSVVRWKRGSGTENAKHPSGRSGFRYLTPFSRPTPNLERDKALSREEFPRSRNGSDS